MYGRTPDDDLLAKEREKKAVSMRLEGYDFDEIAVECGYNDRSGAYKAWKRALKRVPEPVVEEARATMQMRLDKYRKMMARQQHGEHTARVVEVLIKVEEREAKLFSIDVLPDTTFTNPPQIIISAALDSAIEGKAPPEQTAVA